MNPFRILLPRTLLAAVLGAIAAVGTASPAAADLSISFSTGYSARPGHHGPRHGHGIARYRPGWRRGFHHGPPRARRGYRGAYVLSPGCSPLTRRYHDHHGRLVIHHATLCHDRYGRPYVLGGAPRR